MLQKQIKFLYVLYLFLSTLLLSSCNNEVQKKIDIDNLEKKVIAVIFCDFTTRTIGDSTSIKKVAENISKLVYSLPPKSKVYICPIDSSPFVEFIDEYEKPIRSSKPSDMQKYKLWNTKKAIDVAAKIINTHKNVYSDMKIQKKSISCIVRTLKTADGLFSQYRNNNDGNDFIYELIYFSDMIEECKNSSVGHISFRRNFFSKTLNNLHNYKPEFDLSYADVSVIVTAKQPGQYSDFITSDQLMNIWKEIFMKVGFSEKQFREFHFSSTIPVRFQSN